MTISFTEEIIRVINLFWLMLYMKTVLQGEKQNAEFSMPMKLKWLSYIRDEQRGRN